MIKSSAYSSSAIDQVFHRLQLKQKNGIYFEYDIRVDGETLFPRTNSLENFFLFQNFIVSTTELIRFQLYKGKSNRYDCYEFLRSQKNENNDVLSVEQKIEEALKKQKSEFELEGLRSSIVRYKEKTTELKEHVNQLEIELKQSNAIANIGKIIQQSNLFKQGEQPFSAQNIMESQSLNGQTTELQAQHSNTTIQNEQTLSSSNNDIQLMDELTKELVSMLTELKNKLTKETFEKLMGTTLMLGHNPEIITETRNFISLTLQSKTK